LLISILNVLHCSATLYGYPTYKDQA